MSAQALGWVLDESTSSGAARLVLISIANHVDPETGEGWAHVSTILSEANVSEDSYRRGCQVLEAAGELEREVQAGGSARVPAARRPNLFRLPRFAASRAARAPRDAAPPPPQGAVPSPPQDAGPGSRAVQEPLPDPSTNGSEVAKRNEDADRIVDLLAGRVAEHTGHAPKTGAWYRPVDLLLRRGHPDWADPTPVPYDDVAAMIHDIFTNPVRSGGGFCWADVIRSGEALRRHWVKLERWRDQARARPTGRNVDTVGQVLDSFDAAGVRPGATFGAGR